MDAIDKERMACCDLISVPHVLRKEAMRRINDPTAKVPAHFNEAAAAINASQTDMRSRLSFRF